MITARYGAAKYAIAVSALADTFQDQPCPRCGSELAWHVIRPGAGGAPVADCPRRYGEHVTEPQIDLTAPGEPLDSVAVLTPGGIVHVGTGLADTRTGVPVITVEIEPNTVYRPKTAAEDWAAEVRDHLSRIDVRLVQQQARTADPATHYQDRGRWHRKHDMHSGPHDEPPRTTGDPA